MADGSSMLNVADSDLVAGATRSHGLLGSGLSLRWLLLIAGPVIVLSLAAWAYFSGGRFVDTDNAYVKSGVVMISNDVAGVVKEIDVTDNQRVTKGQPLYRLDDAPFRFALAEAEAELSLARAEVNQMKAVARQRQDQVKLAQVDVDYARREWERRRDLFSQHVVPQSAMDQAQQALDAATDRRDDALQQVAVELAGLAGSIDIPTDSHPRVKAALAKVDGARRDLDRTVAVAPIDGIVTKVPSLQVGEYVPAGTAAFGLVAADNLWIEANPKETELTWVRPGQKVEVHIDTYPGLTWDGTIESVSPASDSEFSLLPAQNSSGNWVKVVQRNAIRVSVRQDAGKPTLRAGMSADITIDTGHRRTVSGLLDSLGL